MTNPTDNVWRRYEELRPDELAQLVSNTPIAYWPLGLLEHHGWHLPVGFDGVKAERICIRMAEQTGGVLLPTMWWGGGGGHGPFLWTLHQDEEAAGRTVAHTVEKLIDFGFHAIVALAGHYPWQGTLDRHLGPVRDARPESLLLWGTEMSIAREAVSIKGDHAAREETSFGLSLLPDLIDMDALHEGRDSNSWPQGVPPPEGDRHSGVCFDPGAANFSQMGEDAGMATAERAEAGLGPLVTHLVDRIDRFLEEGL